MGVNKTHTLTHRTYVNCEKIMRQHWCVLFVSKFHAMMVTLYNKINSDFAYVHIFKNVILIQCKLLINYYQYKVSLNIYLAYIINTCWLKSFV